MTADTVAEVAPLRDVGLHTRGIKGIFGARDLIANLTLREIRAQYKRTALGRLWSFINPLAQLAIYTLVFGVVFRSQIPPGTKSGLHNFALWLAAALIPWTYISTAVTNGMNSLLANGGLLTKVSFAREALPISVTLSQTVTFLTELTVVITVMAIFGGPRVLLFIPAVLVAVAIATVFVTGVALVLSVMLVYFRDLQHLIAIFMQMWFYATPVIYPLSMIEDLQHRVAAKGFDLPIVAVYQLNPAERFVNIFRQLLYDFAMPSWLDWLACVVWAAVSLAAGIYIFNRFSSRIVEEL